MVMNELETSLKATNKMRDDNSTKQLLLRLDSTLLYVIWRAEKNSANIYNNYDLPIYFTYNYSSENVGKISRPLVAYVNNSEPNILDYENIDINSEEEFDSLMIRQKFSILEFYLYLSNIRNQIRFKEFEIKATTSSQN